MYIIANDGKLAYGIKTLLIDTKAELASIDTKNFTPGTDVFIAETSERYILNTKHQWSQVQSGGGIGPIPEGSHVIFDGGGPEGYPSK